MHSMLSALYASGRWAEDRSRDATQECNSAYNVYGLSEAAAGRSALLLPVAMRGVLMPLPTRGCAAGPATSNTLSDEGRQCMYGWGRHEAAEAQREPVTGEGYCIPNSVSEAIGATVVMQDGRFGEPSFGHQYFHRIPYERFRSIGLHGGAPHTPPAVSSLPTPLRAVRQRVRHRDRRGHAAGRDEAERTLGSRSAEVEDGCIRAVHSAIAASQHRSLRRAQSCMTSVLYGARTSKSAGT